MRVGTGRERVMVTNRGFVLNQVEQAVMGGELNQLDPIRNPHLVENVREMRFDRVLTD